MHNIITTENILLIGALLLFVAVMAGKAAYRFGAPALLFFLGVGMLFGINFISFHSVEATQFVGMIALCIILFTGGMDTKFSEIRPVIGPGIVLATAGVVMTAVIVAGFVTLIAPWVGLAVSFPAALLLACALLVLPAAAEREPAPSAGAGERFERPDGVRADHCADRRIVRRRRSRERTDEYRKVRHSDGARRSDGLRYRPDRCMDNQSDQFEQSFALSGAFARFRFLYLLVYRPDWRERILGCLPGRIGVG